MKNNKIGYRTWRKFDEGYEIKESIIEDTQPRIYIVYIRAASIWYQIYFSNETQAEKYIEDRIK